MKVYPVYGTTGEFVDRVEWVAVLCTNKHVAEEAVRRLNKAAEGSDSYGLGYFERHESFVKKLKRAGDATPYLDYTGTSYSVGDPIRLISMVHQLEVVS